MARKPTTGGPEYRLGITTGFDERRRKPVTGLRLETTKIFASFSYELSVDLARSGTTLRFRVLGLRTPHLSLPAAGPAHASWEFDDLRGTQEVIVEGLDGRSGGCTIRFTDSGARIIRHPPASFLEVITPGNPPGARTERHP